MTKVVQLISSKSVYNDRLQRELINNDKFTNLYENECINMAEISQNCAEEYHFRCYPRYGLITGIVFRLYLNRYLLKRYSYLKGSIVNIQYVDWFYLLLIPFLKRTFSRIIVCFWGSDLLRVGKLKQKALGLLMKHVDIIALLTEEMIDIFHQKEGYGFDNKIRVVRFGNSYLDMIDNMCDDDIIPFIQKYGIDIERKIIMIGYNSCKEQRHDDVIASIISAQISKEDIFIILPWTYGDDDNNYKNQIIERIQDRYDFAFLDSFLSDIEIVSLRKVTDIMINVQPTDAMSASVYETLYAGGAVIAGSWLPYNDIYKLGVKMNKVDSVSEVGSTLSQLLGSPQSRNVINKNREVIGELYSWKNNIEDWVSLYSAQ